MLTHTHADTTCCLFIINNHGRTSSNIGVYVSSTSPTLAILTTTLVTQDVHTTLVTLDVHTLDIDLISPRYITDARSHSDPSSPITMSHEEHTSAEHSADSGADHHAAVASFTPTIAAISIKLPPFWPADPVVWFAQVEAQSPRHFAEDAIRLRCRRLTHAASATTSPSQLQFQWPSFTQPLSSTIATNHSTTSLLVPQIKKFDNKARKCHAPCSMGHC